jgi:nucleotide-binding universal stress UspA family protein
MFKRILVPTDGSQLADQAVATAIEFARAHGGELVAISVAQPYPAMAAEAAVVMDMQTESQLVLQLAQENVDKVAQQAQAAGVACKTITALSFVPHEEIINAAQDNQCDAIFMASHGRHGISRLLAGSVTQNVLAYSNFPVLVLRPGRPTEPGR